MTCNSCWTEKVAFNSSCKEVYTGSWFSLRFVTTKASRKDLMCKTMVFTLTSQHYWKIYRQYSFPHQNKFRQLWTHWQQICSLCSSWNEKNSRHSVVFNCMCNDLQLITAIPCLKLLTFFFLVFLNLEGGRGWVHRFSNIQFTYTRQHLTLNRSTLMGTL